MGRVAARTDGARADAQARLRAVLHPVELAAISPAGRVEFRLQRELKNYNSRNRHAHWATKHAGRQAWQASLCNALVTALGMAGAQRLLVADSGLFSAHGPRCQTRRRLEIVRLVPSSRHFVKDTFENLPWCAKELRDAITHTGLIRDDSSKWTDTTISQEVSGDGTFWTWIAIDAAEGER